MTKREANSILCWFKKNVGLVGWKVQIVIGDPPPVLGDDIYPSDKNEWYGRNQGTVSWQRAIIWLNPGAHNKLATALYPTEEMALTLMHELLHLFNADIGLDETVRRCEWGNNRLAAVLLKQYRSDHGQA